MEDHKKRGFLKYENKKKNRRGIGIGRSDRYWSDRGEIKAYDRHSHHSRRSVLDAGIKRGAQENWIPSTTCVQRRRQKSYMFGSVPNAHAFGPFKSKYRYLGDICQLLEKNNRTYQENEMIKEIYHNQDQKIISCPRCQYYLRMLGDLPNLDTVDQIKDVKEMYRNRNLSTVSQSII